MTELPHHSFLPLSNLFKESPGPMQAHRHRPTASRSLSCPAAPPAAAAVGERTSELSLSHCRSALASLLLLVASQKNIAPAATLFDANPWPLWGATSSPKHVTTIHPPLRDASPLGATPVGEIPSIGFAVSSRVQRT